MTRANGTFVDSICVMDARARHSRHTDFSMAVAHKRENPYRLNSIFSQIHNSIGVETRTSNTYIDAYSENVLVRDSHGL